MTEIKKSPEEVKEKVATPDVETKKAEAKPEEKKSVLSSSKSGGGKPKPKPDPRRRLFKSDRMTIVAPAPHNKGKHTVPKIMFVVIAALIPAVVMSLIYFGMPAMLRILVAILAAMVAEYACNKIMKSGLTLDDGSAILTGLLLALTLPPSFPLAATALGSAVAIVFGKQVFGGLGANIFNPALLGRAFLQASFPVKITTWTLPFFHTSDAVTGATPLGLFKFGGMTEVATNLKPLFFGNIGGCIGETSALAIIIPALFLILVRIVDWRIPLSYLATVFVFSGILWLVDPAVYPNPVFMLLSGGLLLGAFFMATDMVTSPVTPLGIWIYGVGMGVILVVIRIWGGLPEGVMYSILFMNGLVPLLNRWTRPKYFGEIQHENVR
ncbi:MAG: RnfABCDGE type electron transport complex subunit D [Candidatus Neomarinimicrobiota bacterium]